MRDLAAALNRAESVAVARAAAGDAHAWVVGGAVRDAALGADVHHLDVVVSPGDEKHLARSIADAAGGHSFLLSEEHATWRAVAAAEGWHADVAALRAETLEADLAARDFALNAVAVPLAGGGPIDPLGGLDDAERRVLRAASPASFEDDPLRLLRAARLAAAHALEPDPETVRLARAVAARAAEPAPERQFAELRAMLTGPDPLRALDLLSDLGVEAVVLPELEALRGVEQTPNHHLDVHGHTLAVLEHLLEVEADLDRYAGGAAAEMSELLSAPLADELTHGGALRFGALLHDIGKPETRALRGDRVTFIGHDAVGAELIEGFCARMRTSTRLSAHLQALARHHLRLGFLVHERPLSRRAIYAYLSATEPVGPDVTLLTAADRMAARGEGPFATEEMIEAHLELVREMLGEALAWHRRPPRPPLNGDELAAEVGLAPGPRMGEILEELRAASFAGEIADREAATRRARELAAG